MHECMFFFSNFGSLPKILSPSLGACYADVVSEAWHVCFAAGIQERDGYDMC